MVRLRRTAFSPVETVRPTGRKESSLPTGVDPSRPWLFFILCPLWRTTSLVGIGQYGLAYGNRPSTNPRGCVSYLWGFRLLAEPASREIGVARG
jgi:hypothetical protein